MRSHATLTPSTPLYVIFRAIFRICLRYATERERKKTREREKEENERETERERDGLVSVRVRGEEVTVKRETH